MVHREYDWIDTLRVLATIGVILIHTSGYLLSNFEVSALEYWWIGNFFDGNARFSVPVFFMISGALLLSKDYTLTQFLKKRFFRLIPPFLFWSLIYAIAAIWQDKGVEFFQQIAVFKLLFSKLLSGSSFHLWFVYTLIGVYLFIPIIRKWIQVASDKEIIFFLAIWLITIILKYSVPVHYSSEFDLRYFSGYLGYAVLGYLLFISKHKILKQRWVAITLIIVGNLITIVGTYFLSLDAGTYIGDFYIYLSINVVLSSIGVFLLIKNLTIQNVRFLKTIKFFSKNSYGIYLVHILVLMVMAKFRFNASFAHPLISIPVLSIICFIFSALIIDLMKKNRIGQYVAG